MTTDLIRDYLQEIGRYPLLTPEEEVFYAKQVRAMVEIELQKKAFALQLGRKPSVCELAVLLQTTEREIRLIQHRGQRAKNCIATANLRLVVTVARKYQNSGMELLDLIQEGSLGLYASIEKFDPTKGYKFSTYAYWWIRQGVTTPIAQKANTICLPVNLVEKVNKVKRVQMRLFNSLGRFPTVAEIAESSGLSESKIVECLKYSRRPVSLNLPVGKDEESELAEFIESDDISLVEQIDKQLLEDYLKTILSASLTKQQQEVLRLRYGVDSDKELTLDQIGQQLDLCRERVRQIQNEAIARVRRKIGGIEYSF